MTRAQYEQAFGTNYRKPGFLARMVVAIFKVIPKFGPFKPLSFEPLTPETERLFLESFERSLARYRGSLDRSVPDDWRWATRISTPAGRRRSAPTRWRMKPPWNTKRS